MKYLKERKTVLSAKYSFYTPSRRWRVTNSKMRRERERERQTDRQAETDC